MIQLLPLSHHGAFAAVVAAHLLCSIPKARPFILTVRPAIYASRPHLPRQKSALRISAAAKAGSRGIIPLAGAGRSPAGSSAAPGATLGRGYAQQIYDLLLLVGAEAPPCRVWAAPGARSQGRPPHRFAASRVRGGSAGEHAASRRFATPSSEPAKIRMNPRPARIKDRAWPGVRVLENMRAGD